MVRVLDVQTHAQYAQIALFDPTVDGSYPDWGSGEVEAVNAESGIAVGTRPDRLGPVGIEVWIGSGSESRALRRVLNGTITVVGSAGLVVGSVTGNDLHRVAIPPGRYSVQVFVRGAPDEVDRVSFEIPAHAM